MVALPPDNTPQQTGEHQVPHDYPPRNGRVLWCYAKKWGPIFALIVGGGAAWQTIRSCALVGAGVVGVQTIEQAKGMEAELGSKRIAEHTWNRDEHDAIRRDVATLKEKIEATEVNTSTIMKGMPPSWKRRARNNP
jgi:hypothetical protein